MYKTGQRHGIGNGGGEQDGVPGDEEQPANNDRGTGNTSSKRKKYALGSKF